MPPIFCLLPFFLKVREWQKACKMYREKLDTINAYQKICKHPHIFTEPSPIHCRDGDDFSPLSCLALSLRRALSVGKIHRQNKYNSPKNTCCCLIEMNNLQWHARTYSGFLFIFVNLIWIWFEFGILQEGLDRSWKGIVCEESPQVFSFDLFTSEFCEQLVEEVEAYEMTNLPRRRPNTMNMAGLIVNEIGMEPFMSRVLKSIVAPLARSCFPHDIVAAGGKEEGSNKNKKYICWHKI